LAVALRSRIVDGSIRPGEELPTGKQLAEEFEVATATAQRAVALLQSCGLVEVSRGRRATVLRASATERTNIR
jgi:GntR family transcriptional regulator